MNLVNDIPPGTEDKINVIIEIPEGSRNKYEYNKEHNIFALDRPLNSKFSYPYDYGFIPQTLCEDGDPLDAFVLMRSKTHPGILVECRAIAVIKMQDGGEGDDKLICVPTTDKYYQDVKDLNDLPKQMLAEIKHFLEHYKDVKSGPGVVKITSIEDAAKAKNCLKKAIKMYQDNK